MEKLKAFVEGTAFNYAITAVIVFNAVVLGLETAPSVRAEFGGLLSALDGLCLGIFIIEIGLKIALLRVAFFKSGWNLFDFAIVGLSLLPFLGNLSILRAFRILRVLRLLSLVPRLRVVVEALIGAMPGMGAIVLVLSLVYFVAAVIATKLYGPEFPEDFGTIGDSMFTLFGIMTLEGWMDMALEVMKTHPHAWLFFIPFIIVSSFMILNLFIAIIVNSLQEIEEAEEKAVRKAMDAEAAEVMKEIAALRAEVAALRRDLGKGS